LPDLAMPRQRLDHVMRRSSSRGGFSASRTCERVRDAEVYDAHAASLYRLALLTLDDVSMAEQVVTDVIVDECTRQAAAPPATDASFRLAISACRRCEELDGGPGWHVRDRTLGRSHTSMSCIDPGRFSGQERAALGLVLFCGLATAQVCAALAIPGRGYDRSLAQCPAHTGRLGARASRLGTWFRPCRSRRCRPCRR
jgi:hypothetical protein